MRQFDIINSRDDRSTKNLKRDVKIIVKFDE